MLVLMRKIYDFFIYLSKFFEKSRLIRRRTELAMS